MSFLYPLGLLGLIGVPVLIIIYIIKNKYTEQTVSSTYLWTLSERFLKRKRPIRKIAGLISLLLQIFAVVFLSIAIANPVFVLPNAAQDYCFILDGSGSMNIVQSGKTRLESAKEEIAERIEEAKNGSTYTLVYVGETTNVVYEGLDEKKKALSLLDEIEPTYLAVDATAAIEIAQGYFDENKALQTYLVTDKAYESCKNIHLVNVSQAQENYAVSKITYERTGEESFNVRTDIISYESDATLTVEFYVDGNQTPTETRSVETSKALFTPVIFRYEGTDFRSFAVKVTQSDALSCDNESILYNVDKENEYSALVVSDRPFFIESIFKSVSLADVTVLATKDYKDQNGYDLYVFDTFDPQTLPDDGAVWFFNLAANLDKTGFSYQNTVEIEEKSGAEIELVADGSNASIALTQDLDGKGIYVSKYIKYGLMRNFTTVFEYEGDPLVFSGTNEYGNREVVFAFDLHDSNLPLLLDYITLCRNVLNYSFPTVVDKVDYYSGENATINVVSGCKSIRIESPTGKISYLDTKSETASFLLSEVGVYRVTMTVGETPQVFNVFSALHEDERYPTPKAATVDIAGVQSTEKRDGKYEELIVYFICLALLFMIDWGVYCYDKYQLR